MKPNKNKYVRKKCNSTDTQPQEGTSQNEAQDPKLKVSEKFYESG